MKKFALGLHHLNIAYVAGDYNSYHRQVTESVIPLLDLLGRHSSWCFNIELSGYSIEFIAKHYPIVLNRLKILIESKQIHLISAEYAPRIWFSFPRKDMLKSIEMNVQILNKYDLKASRIYFAQENFFGPGISSLEDWFDTAIIKDDYFYHLYPNLIKDDMQPPYYKLNKQKLVIGWGHILEEMAGKVFKSNEHINSEYAHWPENRLNLLGKALTGRLFASKVPFQSQTWNEIEWTWYHFGSSERFSKFWTDPSDPDRYKFEPQWISVAEKCLETYEEQGFEISAIDDFVNAIETNGFNAPIAPALVEGSWNMKKSRGGFVWMGQNSNDFHNALEIRNQNSITRKQIMELEQSLVIEKKPKLLNYLWKLQLLSETSDSTGWLPKPCEVEFSLSKSKRIHHIYDLLMNQTNVKPQTFSWSKFFNGKEISFDELYVKCFKVYGVVAKSEFFQINSKTQFIRIEFSTSKNFAGVGFNLTENNVRYSPALLEQAINKINLDALAPKQLCLPLTNGLISIDNNLHVIKNNDLFNLCCIVDKEMKSLKFVVEKEKTKPFVCEFLLFQGEINDALKLANQLNRAV